MAANVEEPERPPSPSCTPDIVDEASIASQKLIASPTLILILSIGVADTMLIQCSDGRILVAARNPPHIWASCSRAAPNRASCIPFRADAMDDPFFLLPECDGFFLSTLGASLPCSPCMQSSRSFHEATDTIVEQVDGAGLECEMGI